MTLVEVNLVAVVAAGIVSLIIGFLWYGPLFGKKWAQYMGMKTDNMGKGMAKSAIIGLITAIITAYILAQFIAFAGAADITAGAAIGVLAWLGFNATVLLGSVLWEKRPTGLYLLNTIHYLVVFAVSGAIIAAM